MNSIKLVLFILHIISFVFLLFFSAIGLYEQIMGPIDTDKLLKKLKIPLTYKQFLIASFIDLFIVIVLYILRSMLFGQLL